MLNSCDFILIIKEKEKNMENNDCKIIKYVKLCFKA